jgi:hypothetical protein
MMQLHNFRAWLAFVHDLCAAGLAWAALYWLRFGLDFHQPFLADMARTLVWILPLQAAIFVAFGLYRGLWRFASVLDLQRIVLAAGLGALLIPLVLVMLQLQAVVPRSVLISYPVMLIFLMAGDRFAYRIWKEHRLYSPFAALGEPVLVIGAGEAGARLTREFARSRQWRVVGLIDDDPAKQDGSSTMSACWAHRAFRLGQEVRRAAGDRRAPRLRTVCAGVSRRSAPTPDRGADRAVVRGSDQRPFGADHDPDDRARRPAGRDPVVLDNAGLGEWLGNRVVMVTAPAARSAPSFAGTSRGSARRNSCCSTCPRPRSTRSRRRSPTASRSCRWRRSWATSSTPCWSTRC